MAVPDVRGFLRGKYARILSVVLLVQAALFYTASHGESIPLERPLDAFPTQVEDWHLSSVGVIPQDDLAVLRADDTLTRWYESKYGGANLFIAFFKTQRTGQTPHSPKNCLPGAGWSPTAIGYVDVPIPIRNETIQVNRYIVTKGDQKSLVLYWYQTQHRVIANEFSAKFWLVADSVRNHRSDTALVRVVVPVTGDHDDAATKAGIAFVQAMYPALRAYLPS